MVQVEYLNLSAVKHALHVPPDAFFFQCDNGVGFNYKGNTKALMPFYRHVIEQTPLRVLARSWAAEGGASGHVPSWVGEPARAPRARGWPPRRT